MKLKQKETLSEKMIEGGLLKDNFFKFEDIKEFIKINNGNMIHNQYSGLILSDLNKDELAEIVERFSDRIIQVLKFDNTIDKFNKLVGDKLTLFVKL